MVVVPLVQKLPTVNVDVHLDIMEQTVNIEKHALLVRTEKFVRIMGIQWAGREVAIAPVIMGFPVKIVKQKLVRHAPLFQEMELAPVPVLHLNVEVLRMRLVQQHQVCRLKRVLKAKQVE